MLWVGLQCVIVVFPDHTHLLFPYSSTGYGSQFGLYIVLHVMDDNLAYSSKGYGWQFELAMDGNSTYSSTGYWWQFGLKFYRF